MAKSASKKITAGQMADHLAVTKAEPAPDDAVDALSDLLVARVPGTSKEGKALRKLLPQIREKGLTIRQLEALQVAMLAEVMHGIRTGTLDAIRGQIQVQKALDSLRLLVVDDQTPDSTVPGNIEIKVTLAPDIEDDGPGDAISVTSARGPSASDD